MNNLKNFYIIIRIFFLSNILVIIFFSIGAFLYLSAIRHETIEQKEYSKMLTEKKLALTSLKARYEKVATSSKVIDEVLPREKDASKLISDIDLLTRSSGLEFLSIRVDSTGSERPPKKKSLLQTQQGEYSQEMSFIMSLRGSYNNLISFVKAIESYQRLANIKSIEIRESDRENAPPDEINATLNVTVYLKK